MSEAPVQLKVAGQTYHVVTSAEPAELTRLAAKVEDALYGVTPDGRQPSPQALVLAAITLAHELEEERAKRVELEERHRRVLESLLGKVDRVLNETSDFKSVNSPAAVHSKTKLRSLEDRDSHSSDSV